MSFVDNLRNQYKITLSVLAGSLGVFFNFIGLCVGNSATASTNPNPWGVNWFFLFFYIFFLASLVWATATDTLKSNRFLLLALASITMAYIPIDMNESLLLNNNTFYVSGINTGASLKVAGLVIFVFPLLFILMLLGADEDSIIHSGVGVPSFGMGGGSGESPQKTPAPAYASGNPSYASGNPYASQQYGQTNIELRPQSEFVNPIAALSNPEADAANEARNSMKPSSRLNLQADSVVAFKARALYAYEANASDPTEISFKKGEILNVIDSKGKWWHVQRVSPDGSITSGIAPSNYLQAV